MKYIYRPQNYNKYRDTRFCSQLSLQGFWEDTEWIIWHELILLIHIFVWQVTSVADLGTEQWLATQNKKHPVMVPQHVSVSLSTFGTIHL